MIPVRFIGLFLFLGISLTGSAQAVSGPRMAYDVFTVEYGEVEYGSDGERTWTFKNTGTEPLLITEVKGSCGCTVAKYPKTPIKPGEGGTVKIKYDTKRPGIISKTITLITNEPEERNFHVIKIMGKVVNAPEKAQPKKGK